MLSKENCGLIVVDIQGSLARIVQNSDIFIANTRKLIQCCKLLSIPVIWLEQNPQGLGDTIPEISELLSDSITVNEKTHFNALFEESIKKVINDTKKKQWLVAGIEAHVCVYQTVIGLLSEGFETEVVTDCISSRAQSNIDVAVEKMQRQGANITSLEMCVFELMRDAKSAEFKQVLSVIK